MIKKGGSIFTRLDNLASSVGCIVSVSFIRSFFASHAFFCSPSFVLSFFFFAYWLERNDNEPESFFSPLQNGFNFFSLQTNTSSRKDFTIVTRVCVWVERSRSDRIGWSVAPGRKRNSNVMLQLTLAISLSFFPELILNTMVFILSHYLTIRN